MGIELREFIPKDATASLSVPSSSLPAETFSTIRLYEQVTQPFRDTIAQKDQEIASLRAENQELRTENAHLNAEIEKLWREGKNEAGGHRL